MTRRSKSSVVQVSDAEVLAAARNALDLGPLVPPELQLEVEHGYVTLSGTVRGPQESESIERTVRAVAGVNGVINNIVVAHVPVAGGWHRSDQQQQGGTIVPNYEDGRPMQDPMAELERQLIRAYLAGSGNDFETLVKRDDEAARRLLAAASEYASAKLSEMEARLHYLRSLQGHV